jgi:hypothetical protein
MKINMIGNRFGLLTVIAVSTERIHGNISWDCVCDCGGAKTCPGNALRSGTIKSCGCINGSFHPDHGRTLRIWRGMRQRCYNPKNQNYHRYGGIGVTVCFEWEKFQNFLSDMGYAPPGFQIDRINNDRGYEPGNCRWTTRLKQARNKRTNRMLSYKGETRCISEWCEKLDLKYATVLDRSHRYDNPHWILLGKPKEAP